MKILVTGFDPFGGETVNPALKLLNHCRQRFRRRGSLYNPTVFYKATEVLETAIVRYQPDVVLHRPSRRKS